MPVSPAAIQKGALYVVATPIGNMDDLSPRARAVLSQVDLIAAEDTRHTARLLAAIGAKVRLLSLHEHNEERRAAVVLDELSKGLAAALVSDAGTPLISDPGFNLVRAATDRKIPVIAIPGPCAAITALSIAGFPTDRFVFEGFLPAKATQRRERLQQLLTEERTMVFYEAPHRIAESLEAMMQAFGRDRRGMIARELTKMFESRYYGTLEELFALAGTDSNLSRGELVVVIAGRERIQREATSLDAEQTLRILLGELPATQAAKLTAKLCGLERAKLYDLAVQWKNAGMDRDKKK